MFFSTFPSPFFFFFSFCGFFFSSSFSFFFLSLRRFVASPFSPPLGRHRNGTRAGRKEGARVGRRRERPRGGTGGGRGQVEGTPPRSRVRRPVWAWPGRGYAAQVEGTPPCVGVARSRVRRPGRGYAACVGVAGSRVRRSVRRLLQGASGGWRARLQRVDRLAPEKRVGCAGCPPLFPTTVSRSCPAPAIIFAELGRPAPLGGLPHDSSCGECAGTTRRKEKKSKR